MATRVARIDRYLSSDLKNKKKKRLNALLIVLAEQLVGALTLVEDNDHVEAHPQSQVTFSAHAQTTFFIAVDGVDGAQGEIALAWTIGQPHDNFADAIDIP